MIVRIVFLHCLYVTLVAASLVVARTTPLNPALSLGHSKSPHASRDDEIPQRLYPRVFDTIKAISSALKNRPQRKDSDRGRAGSRQDVPLSQHGSSSGRTQSVRPARQRSQSAHTRPQAPPSSQYVPKPLSGQSAFHPSDPHITIIEPKVNRLAHQSTSLLAQTDPHTITIEPKAYRLTRQGTSLSTHTDPHVLTIEPKPNRLTRQSTLLLTQAESNRQGRTVHRIPSVSPPSAQLDHLQSHHNPPTRIPSPSFDSGLGSRRRASSSLSPVPLSIGSSRSASLSPPPRRPKISSIPIHQTEDPSRRQDRNRPISPNDPRNEHRLIGAYWTKGGLVGIDSNRPRHGVTVLDGDPGLSGTDAAQMEGALRGGIRMEWDRSNARIVSDAQKKQLKAKLRRVEPAGPEVRRVNTERRARGRPEVLQDDGQKNKGESPSRQHGPNPGHGQADFRTYHALDSSASDSSGTTEWVGWSSLIRGDVDGRHIDSMDFRTQNLQDTRLNREVISRTKYNVQRGDESLIVPGGRGGPKNRYFTSDEESSEARAEQEERARRTRQAERRRERDRREQRGETRIRRE